MVQGAPMVATFVCSPSTPTQGVWRFPEKASRADIRLVELEHLSFKKMIFCLGRVPIYVHPSFYRALTLKYPMDEGGMSRDGRVTTELSTGSLRHAVGILTPNDFWNITNSELGKWPGCL